MGYAERTVPTQEEYAAYRQRLSNWGRWGADDQFGTLNFITPEVSRAAASLVRAGRSISCSRLLTTKAVMPNEFRNPKPAEMVVTVTPGQPGDPASGGAVDQITVSYHGLANTHLDALCHVFALDNQIYNGRSASTIHEDGAETNSVEPWRDGIVTRGVLYDIALMRGTHVEADAPVQGWELDDFAAQHGITPRAGDAVLVRSGSEAFWATQPSDHMPPRPGVGVSTLEFLQKTDAALLGWDLMESAGQGLDNPTPVHRIAIPYMGLPLLDNSDFERLSEVCASTGRYEFLFTVAPLVVQGGTGSPVNPLAIF